MRHVDSYSTWGEFVHRAEHRIETAERNASRESERRGAWYGTPNFEAALKLATEGWMEGAELCEKFASALYTGISNLVEREDIHFDTQGREIDVALYLDNEPECWMDFRTEITEGVGRKIVHIVMNCSASCDIDPKVITAKGAAVVALVHLLELAGNGVTLDVASATSSRTVDRAEVIVNLKRADQPLDLPRVAFAIAHPSMLRRMVFAVQEGWPAEVRRRFGIGSTYGYPADAHEHGDIYVGQSFSHVRWTDPKTAEAWVIGQLEACGVQLTRRVA